MFGKSGKEEGKVVRLGDGRPKLKRDGGRDTLLSGIKDGVCKIPHLIAIPTQTPTQAHETMKNTIYFDENNYIN